MASCLAVTMTSGVASAETTSGVASVAIRAGHTIASAGTLSLGKKTIGGGGHIDFWRVPLLGGDQLQLIVKTPNSPCCAGYRFELYQPGTTDATFPQRPAVMGTSTANGSSGAVLVLQAPYNGTFILAVCEGAGDCRDVDSGGGINPMGAYSFTGTLVSGGVNAKVGAKETRASTTIAKAVVTRVGHFEASGGNGIDFWKVPLLGGDQVQLSIQTPYSTCCAGYRFELYQPGTTDTNFPQRPPVMAVSSAQRPRRRTLVGSSAPTL